MKKFRNAIVLLAAGVAFAACQNNGKTAANAGANDSTANDSAATDSVVYEGRVPAADGPGIKYQLACVNDSSKGFRLTTTYLQAEKGKDQVSESKGKYEVVKKTVAGKEGTFYKLPTSDGSGETVLKVVNDSTLRLVNSDFEEAASKLNYDLKLKK